MLKKLMIMFSIVAFLGFMSVNANAGFGIKGGTTSSVWDVELSGVEVKGNRFEDASGFTAGFFFPKEINDVFTIQPELLYTQKGTIENYMGYTLETSLDYIELPLLFKFSLLINDTIYPNLFFGPYVAYLINAEDKVNNGVTRKITALNDFDAGAVVGAGIDFKVSGHKITLEGRYSRGMVNIADSNFKYQGNETDQGNKTDVRNESIMFLVGFTF